jgi:hypothetical protein
MSPQDILNKAIINKLEISIDNICTLGTETFSLNTQKLNNK